MHRCEMKTAAGRELARKLETRQTWFKEIFDHAFALPPKEPGYAYECQCDWKHTAIA